MKKLRLKALELGAIEVLTRAQMKKVRGGGGIGGQCLDNSYYGCEGSIKCCPGCSCVRANNDWQCQGTCPYS